MFDSVAHGLQHVKVLYLPLSPKVCSNSWPLGWWSYLTISSSASLFFLPQSFSASGSFPMSQFFTSGGQSTGTSASASVLQINIQGWLVWSPCCPIDVQESSPALQFESINSLMLSLLYGPTVTSVPDYRKNYSFDYMNHGCYRAFKTGWVLCKVF